MSVNLTSDAELIEAWNRRAPIEGTAGEAERSETELPDEPAFVKALRVTCQHGWSDELVAYIDALRAYATRPHALPAGWIPEPLEHRNGMSDFGRGLVTGWNDCRNAMLSAEEKK